MSLHDATARQVYTDPHGGVVVDAANLDSARSITLGAGVRFDLRLTAFGFDATLQGPWPEHDEVDAEVETHWRAVVRVVPPIAAAVSSFYDDGLHLSPLLHAASAGDALARPEQLVMEMLGEAAAAAAVESLRGSLQVAAAHLVAKCCPAALEVARLFPADHMMRWHVYEVCAADKSGRIAQLAQSCPGLLILSKALRDNEGARASERILAAVVRGTPLRQVLDLAVELWSATRHRVVGAKSEEDADALRRLHAAFALGDPPRRIVWQLRRLLGDSGSQDGSVARWDLASQRLRIKRARHGVAPRSLWRPPVRGVVPEDIPKDGGPNAAWFASMSTESLIRRNRTRLSGEQRLALNQFVSLHWQWLHGFASATCTSFDAVVSDLLSFFAATGRRPSRKSSPARIVQESMDWHHMQQRRPARVVARRSAGRPLRLPPFPGDTLDLPGGPPRDDPEAKGRVARRHGPLIDGDDSLLVFQLRTHNQFLRESKQMSNCVQDYFDDAVEGRSVFFHTELDGKPATVEIAADGDDGFQIVQAKGKRNARLPIKYWIELYRWLAEINLAIGR